MNTPFTGSKMGAVISAALLLVAAIYLLLGALFFSEGANVWLFASAETIRQYYFGSEAMVGGGHWYYSSKLLYVLACLVPSTPACCGAIVVFFGTMKRRASLRNAGIAMLVFATMLWAILMIPVALA